MRALMIDHLGAAPRLEPAAATPTPGPGEALVRVRACGLNFADLLMIEGKYQERQTPPFSPGMEIAGEVIGLGPGVDGLAVGQRVAAFSGHGGLAEQALAPAARCVPLPDDMDFVTAAAFQVAYGTSHMALLAARLAEGETLLVLGAAGGVGLTAVEIGHRMGARVIACASTPEKRAAAMAKGADLALDNRGSFHQAVLDATAGRGADLVYDPVGGEIFTESLRCIARRGRLLVIGFASGTLPRAPANRVLLKDCDIVGVRAGEYGRQDPRAGQRMKEDLMALADAGHLKPHVTDVLPVTEANAALQRFVDRNVAGKIVLEMPAARA